MPPQVDAPPDVERDTLSVRGRTASRLTSREAGPIYSHAVNIEAFRNRATPRTRLDDAGSRKSFRRTGQARRLIFGFGAHVRRPWYAASDRGVSCEVVPFRGFTRRSSASVPLH